MPKIPDTGTRLTRKDIAHEIRTVLGGTRFAIELDQQQIDVAINRAVRTFRRYLFGTVTVAVKGVVGQAKYALPAGGFAITRFDVLSTDRPHSAEAELNVFELNRARIYGFYGDRPGALAELIQHVEQSRRVRGTEPEYWHIQDDTVAPPVNDIVVYVPAGPRDVSYDVAIAITEPEHIPFVHEQLFLSYIEGECRMMLGNMRGKYGGSLPGPTGELTLDAESQKTRGQELVTLATEELRKLSLAMPPVTGGG